MQRQTLSVTNLCAALIPSCQLVLLVHLGFRCFVHLPWVLHDPLRYYTNLARRYGDVASFRIGSVVINEPVLIDKLVRDRTCLRSRETRRMLPSVFGDGLLSLSKALRIYAFVV